ILHTILFHRALGLVRPKDVECELFDITYVSFFRSQYLIKVRNGGAFDPMTKNVQCGDHELEKKIDEKINQFIGWVEKHPNRKSQVYAFSIAGYNFFSYIVQPNLLYLMISENAFEESNSRCAALESSLREVLFQIIRFVNEKKDHIPPLQNSEIVSYPYEISTPSSSDSSFGWHADVLKRMLQTGHPSMLS
ncbi:hypothetical protein BHE74_00055480, partial [Ensete ventricosum]